MVVEKALASFSACHKFQGVDVDCFGVCNPKNPNNKIYVSLQNFIKD
jgi:hypothetical protein